MFFYLSTLRTNLRRRTCGVVVAGTLTFSATALAASYMVTDLGTLGLFVGKFATGSFARGINARGRVVGNSDGRAFFYENGSMTDLDPWAGGNNVGNAINNNAQVVGWSQDAAGNLHAFSWRSGITTDLWLGRNSEANGINDRGQVVGWYEGSGGVDHAFLLSGGTMADLGLGNARSVANGINASGQVVGTFVNGSGFEHAFLSSKGSITELGGLGGTPVQGYVQSEGYGINALGQAVGQSHGRAFLYSGGKMIDLGEVPAYSDFTGGFGSYAAYGINAAGQVVGTFSYSKFLIAPQGFSRAWVYSDGTMRDLTSLIDPSSGWDISQAIGINDAGQIIANGCGPPGCRALLLSPVTTTVVEYQNTQDFPGSPGGHFFYTDEQIELAIVDSGSVGRFVRTGRTFNSGGTKQLCRFYGSVVPGPNSHFYTLADRECDLLKAVQRVPTPTNAQQWNYEGLRFSEVPPQIGDTGSECTAGTIPVYRAYNNAYPFVGPKNAWDSAHRYSANRADIQQMVAQFGWSDEGIVFCSLQ